MPGVKTELLNPRGSQSFWGDGIWVHWWEGNDHTEKGLFYIILLTSLLSRVFISISRWGKQSLSLLICSGHKPRHSWDWNPGFPDSMLKLFISILLGLPPAGPLLTPSPMAGTSFSLARRGGSHLSLRQLTEIPSLMTPSKKEHAPPLNIYCLLQSLMILTTFSRWK